MMKLWCHVLRKKEIETASGTLMSPCGKGCDRGAQIAAKMLRATKPEEWLQK